MRNNLDERQKQTVGNYMAGSCLVMYALCVVTIIVQLLLTNGDIRLVFGETIVMLAGGVIYIIGEIKAGSFSNYGRSGKAGKSSNVVVSIMIAAIFSILFAIIIERKIAAVGKEIPLGKYVVFFFCFISVLCFLVLTLLEVISQKTMKKAEQIYDDTELVTDQHHMKKQKQAVKSMNPQNIYFAGSSMEADSLIEMLEKNGIAAFKKEIGGGVMDTYSGFSNKGDYIYVDSADAELARKIVEQYKMS